MQLLDVLALEEGTVPISLPILRIFRHISKQISI